MILLIILAVYFALGAVGAWLGERHFIRKYGPGSGCEFCALITFICGPIGLAAALLFLAMIEEPSK